MVDIYAYPNSQDASYSLGEYIVDAQDKVLATEPVFRIAISGGSLVGALQEGLLLNQDVASRVKWGRWEIYFVDERLLPLSYEDSNYGFFKRKVAGLIPARDEQPKIVAINTTLMSPTGATDANIAADYAKKLPDHCDVIILGCGEDGHICSLFPDHPALLENTKDVDNISDSPKPPPRRITFTFPYIKRATQIAFYAQGPKKADVLDEVFDGKHEGLPAAMVNKLSLPVVWFVDQASIGKALEKNGLTTTTYK